MKKLPFKKGDKVVYVTEDYGKIHIQEGEVTVVATRDGSQVVHVRTPDQWGGYWKRSFSPIAGMFQENPYPIWKLRVMNGDNIKNLKKRAEKATALFRKYQEAYQAIQNQVEAEANKWKYEEIARRAAVLPNGAPFLRNVVARLGFKKPKNGVKVKVNGVISTVK